MKIKTQKLLMILGLILISGCSNEANEHRKNSEKVGGEIIYLTKSLGHESGRLFNCGSINKAQYLESETKSLIDEVGKARKKYIEITIEINKEHEAKGNSILSESGSTAISLLRVEQHHDRLIREFYSAKEIGKIEISNSSPEKRKLLCQSAESIHQKSLKAITFASNNWKKYFVTSFVGEGSWSDS